MATLDIAILVVIGLSAVIGLVRGLVKEVLSLASWVLAFLVALYFSGQAAEYLPATWGSATVRTGIAFVILFVVTLVLAAIGQWLIAQLVSTTGLSGTDRLLGFLFGSARGLIICIVALMGIREVAGNAQWWEASVLQVELLEFEDEVRDLLGRAREVVSEVPLPSV